jgi:hypothetical protein
MNKAIKTVLKPILRHATKDLTDDDVWSKQRHKLAKEVFGMGNHHGWDWYLEGRSRVKVKSAKEIVDWLRDCEYVGDLALFNEKDFWQHTVTFEELRKGDCEDHALWAWRKLKELGIPAEFVVGRSGPATARGNHAHAWIQLELSGQPCLMETVANKRQQMTFPLDDVRRKYCPAYSVDTNLITYRYGGHIEFARLQLESEEKE